MEKIFLLEDDEELGRGIAMALEGGKRAVIRAATIEKAREILAEERFDLLILDVNLPDGSGLDLLRRIRQGSAVPAIFLTANDMEMDEVAGLEAGADDYITKPFSLAVLRARVEVQLRRAASENGGALQIGPFSFDFERLEFRRHDIPIELSRTEQRLLRVLVDNRGRTVPRSVLMDRVWTDGGEYVDENALSVTMKRLRGKIEADPSQPEFLKTVYGIGYTWAVTL